MQKLNDLNTLKEKALKIQAKRDTLIDSLTKNRLELESTLRRKVSGEKGREFLKSVAYRVQKNLEFRLSSLITTALLTVFHEEDPPEFVTRFEERRNTMECDLLFKKHGKEYLPLDGDGGGPADVADFALRIAFWSLSKNRPVFVLDEPFKFVSYDLQGKVSDMLRMICDKLNIQIIMVSHQLGINKQADKTFKVVKESGISRVIEV